MSVDTDMARAKGGLGLGAAFEMTVLDEVAVDPHGGVVAEESADAQQPSALKIGAF